MNFEFVSSTQEKVTIDKGRRNRRYSTTVQMKREKGTKEKEQLNMVHYP